VDPARLAHPPPRGRSCSVGVRGTSQSGSDAERAVSRAWPSGGGGRRRARHQPGGTGGGEVAPEGLENIKSADLEAP
jgi:hypothetical protein